MPFLKKEKIPAKLTNIDQNNNIVLDAGVLNNTLGEIVYNLADEYIKVSCYSIYFRTPGEHTLENLSFDMELQVNCTGRKPYDADNYSKMLVSIPVKIATETESTTTFFDNFADFTFDKVYEIDHLQSLLGYLTQAKTLYYYEGSKNFPNCEIGFSFLFVSQPVFISRTKWDMIYNSRDKTKAPQGNNRVTLNGTDVKLLEFN